jgi:hypothetical protein
MSQLENRFGSDFPGTFFQSRELNATKSDEYATVDQLWNHLLEEQAVADDDISTVTNLRRQTQQGALYFRGQSNQGHGLSSSLHRLVGRESPAATTESLLSDLEETILEDARSRGLGKSVSPGQLLMILQHHFAPTRLIDVSLTPLEALFFAVESNDAVDGRLFIIALNERPDKPSKMKLSASEKLPWKRHVRNAAHSDAEWTQSVQLVDEEPLDPRMIAQRGRFLVGGVQRAYADLNIWFEDKQLRVVERQKISMLCMAFPKGSFRTSGTGWPAIGWTVRIPRAWKSELRTRLAADFNIDRNSTYPDLGNIQWHAEIAARDSLNGSDSTSIG